MKLGTGNNGSAEPSLAPCAFGVEDVGCGSRHTVVPTGELDMASAVELEASVVRLSENGTERITLDLRQLKFVDCCGVRAVVTASGLCAAQGYEFRVIPGPPAVQRVFELTRLAERVPGATPPDSFRVTTTGHAAQSRPAKSR